MNNKNKFTKEQKQHIILFLRDLQNSGQSLKMFFNYELEPRLAKQAMSWGDSRQIASLKARAFVRMLVDQVGQELKNAARS